jgi:hypothetical protein
MKLNYKHQQVARIVCHCVQGLAREHEFHLAHILLVQRPPGTGKSRTILVNLWTVLSPQLVPIWHLPNATHGTHLEGERRWRNFARGCEESPRFTIE